MSATRASPDVMWTRGLLRGSRKATVVPSTGEVHLWSATIADLEPEHRWATLDEQERARAQRFRKADDRRRFVAGRVLLRDVLAGYLGASAESLQFAFGARGKPELAQLSREPMPRFSLSHSGEWLTIAVARCPVGVDLEYTGAIFDVDAVACVSFSPQETRLLRMCGDGEARRNTFFRIWTRKEAWTKATGEGLAYAIGSATPSFPAGWSGAEFSPAPNYAAAVVIEGDLEALTHLGWGALAAEPCQR